MSFLAQSFLYFGITEPFDHTDNFIASLQGLLFQSVLCDLAIAVIFLFTTILGINIKEQKSRLARFYLLYHYLF